MFSSNWHSDLLDYLKRRQYQREIYIPVDCEFGDWKNWTTCDRPCDGGEQYRTREVKTFAKHGGELCQGDAKEVQVCNPQPCPSKSRWDRKFQTIKKN